MFEFGSVRPIYPSQIIHNFLYLGSLQSAEDRRVLRDLRITRVVNLTVEGENPFENDPSFSYCLCPIDDRPDVDISLLFDSAFDFIEKARSEKQRCLVHCAMGISRSCAIVLYYLMKSQRISLCDAFHHVSACRPSVNPNRGFLSKLLKAEQNLGISPHSVLIFDPQNSRKIPVIMKEDSSLSHSTNKNENEQNS
jgi:protein-tyrosine phosphatase